MASLVVLERRDGRKEVARLRQALRPDGAELREPEWRTVVLTDITARLLFEQQELPLRLNKIYSLLDAGLNPKTETLAIGTLCRERNC